MITNNLHTPTRTQVRTGRIHDRALYQSRVAVLLALTITLAIVNPCNGQEYSAGDWIPFQPGTNVLMGYYAFATSSSLDNTIAGAVPDSSLDGDIGIVRFMHYAKLLGHTIAIQGIVPFGSLNNAKLNGQGLREIGRAHV